MLAKLSEPYSTSIRVGGMVFNLRAYPLFDEKNNRNGYVVEWTDSSIMDTHKVGGEINNIQDVVSVVAGAVEEQSAVAREMSSNMQNASQSMNEVSGNLNHITNALQDVKSSVAQTKKASDAIVN